ncbi:GGDEF domain-containing protein [Nocardioides sp. W3-2-3]|nr:GGDEF domain-containing protein [Nocardioides convexus]
MSRRAGRVERPPGLDLALLAAAVAVIAGTAWVHDLTAPEWNPFSLVALACVPVLIRFGMVVESASGALRASTAPAILFAYDLREPQALPALLGDRGAGEPCRVLRPAWDRARQRRGAGGGGDGRGRAPGGRRAVAAGPGAQCDGRVLRDGGGPGACCARGGVPARLLDGVRRSDLRLVIGGLFLACVVVVVLRTAYNDTPKVVTGLLGAGCLAAFVTAQILMARLQANVRGVEALTAAGEAMPWPGPQIDALLVRFVRTAVRAGDVRIASASGTGPGVLSVPLEGGTHLVVERTRGDLPFNRSEAGLLRSLARLASTARTQAVQQSRLLRQATTDDLTGLQTYAQFRLKVEAHGLGRSAEQRMVVMFLDLDGFAGLTERIGHLDSDLVLREIGERLRTRLPEKVEMCRFGSDEFVVMATCPDDAATQQTRAEPACAGRGADGRRGPDPAGHRLARRGESRTAGWRASTRCSAAPRRGCARPSAAGDARRPSSRPR